jgi:MFS family permease
VIADALSFLLSALSLKAITGQEPHPTPTSKPRNLTDGWHDILTNPALRGLFLNTILVNALIMAPAPLLAVLMLGDLGFAPWQYGLAFATPCLGGLIGARLAPRLAARFGTHQVMITTGVLRVLWPVGLAFIHPGPTGLLLVIGVELGLITCMGVFTPLFATYRLHHADRVASTLAAWSISGNATTAATTALWGLLAALTGPRTAIAAAGVLLLATPLLLPRRL